MFSKKPLRYTILKALSIGGLQKDVTSYIEDGWIPVGGVAKTWFGQYFQALWRPDAE